MKIDLDFKFANLKGEVQDGALHAGEYLANVMAADDTQKDNAIKFNDWAMSLYKRKELDVDKQDAELIQTFISTVAKVPATIRAQLKTVVAEVIAKNSKKTPDKESDKKS